MDLLSRELNLQQTHGARVQVRYARSAHPLIQCVMKLLLDFFVLVADVLEPPLQAADLPIDLVQPWRQHFVLPPVLDASTHNHIALETADRLGGGIVLTLN